MAGRVINAVFWILVINVTAMTVISGSECELTTEPYIKHFLKVCDKFRDSRIDSHFMCTLGKGSNCKHCIESNYTLRNVTLTNSETGRDQNEVTTKLMYQPTTCICADNLPLNMMGYSKSQCGADNTMESFEAGYMMMKTTTVIFGATTAVLLFIVVVLCYKQCQRKKPKTRGAETGLMDNS